MTPDDEVGPVEIHEADQSGALAVERLRECIREAGSSWILVTYMPGEESARIQWLTGKGATIRDLLVFFEMASDGINQAVQRFIRTVVINSDTLVDPNEDP
jgi:hypothetical protein